SRVFACSGLAIARDDRRALWCKRSRAIGADAWRAADAAIDAARDKHRARLRALRQPCNVYAFEGYRSPVNATGGRSEIIDTSWSVFRAMAASAVAAGTSRCRR